MNLFNFKSPLYFIFFIFTDVYGTAVIEWFSGRIVQVYWFFKRRLGVLFFGARTVSPQPREEGERDAH